MLNPISIAAFALWDLALLTPKAVRKVEALIDLRRGQKAEESRHIVRLEVCVTPQELLEVAAVPSLAQALARVQVLRDTRVLPHCGHCGAAEALS